VLGGYGKAKDDGPEQENATTRTVWTTRETLVRFWPLADIQSGTDSPEGRLHTEQEVARLL
jgi:hypothetical protein